VPDYQAVNAGLSTSLGQGAPPYNVKKRHAVH